MKKITLRINHDQNVLSSITIANNQNTVALNDQNTVAIIPTEEKMVTVINDQNAPSATIRTNIENTV